MFELDRHLSLEDFNCVAREKMPVQLSDAARERIEHARAFVESIVLRGDAVYGINTGFGKFQNTRIDSTQLKALQRNLILSHAVGVGTPFETDVVRGMMLLRAQSLALGHSGVRVCVVERLLDFLNCGIHPIVPSQGSVGSSGDLAPLSHLALALIGEGSVEYMGKVRLSRDVLEEMGWTPLELQAKEGLALINGTQAMCSLLALLVWDVEKLLKTADMAAAMSLEALKGSHKPFDPKVIHVRPHPGTALVSQNMRGLLSGSEIAESHAFCEKVQDAYSLRAVPQVHGASRDAFTHIQNTLQIEMNSVTDNPVLFPDEGEVLSAGNFHGQSLALAADYIAIAIAELANISERRIEQMLNPALSDLPAFLAEQGGLNSGFMIAQYTAASLVSENKVLAHPASVDSIPTSANQEDHVSMGTIACRKAKSILDNTFWVLSIELLVAAQALDFHRPLKPGKGVEAVRTCIRQKVAFMDTDRYFRPDIERVREMILNGTLIGAVESTDILLL
ncbi:MAG: histidine ammonia-lyase [Deinococcaceae bacterium]